MSSHPTPDASPRRGFLLEATVFVVGMGTLGAEIAAARLLAPWFGASTIMWANTITDRGYCLGLVGHRPVCG